MLHKELRDVRELALPAAREELPSHLAGLPDCLHKYGPLLAAQLADQQASDEATAA